MPGRSDGVHQSTGADDLIGAAYNAVAAAYARAIRGTNHEHPLDVAMIEAVLAEVGERCERLRG